LVNKEKKNINKKIYIVDKINKIMSLNIVIKEINREEMDNALSLV